MIKEWLNRNKVFFDVFAAIALGTASVVVSYAAYEINKRQLALAEVAALPHFSIEIRNIFGSDKKLREKALLVRNLGAPAYNLESRISTFLVLSRLQNKVKQHYIPLWDYLQHDFPSTEDGNTVLAFRGKDNAHNLKALMADIATAAESKGVQLFMSTSIVIELRYTDRMGNKRSDYFRDGARITHQEAADYLAASEALSGPRITDLTGEKVLYKITEGQTFVREIPITDFVTPVGARVTGNIK